MSEVDNASDELDIFKLQPEELFPDDVEAMEEGEADADTVPQDDNPVKAPTGPGVRTYDNTQTWLGGGVLPSQKKLEERAARFGITSDVPKRLTDEKLEDLYDSCGIPQFDRDFRKQLEGGGDPSTLKREPHWRLNVLNLRGVDDMSTEEIFKYFTAFSPLSIEWVNDTSCNVVWEDRLAAARALVYMSQGVVSEKQTSPSKPELSKLDAEDNGRDDVIIAEEEEGEVIEMDCEEGEIAEEPTETAPLITMPDEKVFPAKGLPIAVPAGFVWRLGKPSDKSKAILMRFATVEDRKAPRAEKQSQYYRKYGNPNFRGMTGLISESRKRRYLEERGRRAARGGSGAVHALDRSAEAPVSKKNPWGALAAAWSEEWRAQDAPHTPPAPPPSTHSPKSSVRDGESDLNLSFSESSSESDSDDVVEWESRNKRPRMRMYADDVESAAKTKKKLRTSRERNDRQRWAAAAMVADVEERPVARPRSGGAIPRSRTMDSTEPRPRSRRNNRRGADTFMSDLRRKLSRNTKDDDPEILDDEVSNGVLEKTSLKITITNADANGRRRGSDSDDDEDYDSSPRRRPVRRRSDDRGLRARLRRPPVTHRDNGGDEENDEDSDEVPVRSGVPDLREKLRQKRGEGAETTKKTGAFSPLRIEVDNEAYYGIIGSESD